MASLLKLIPIVLLFVFIAGFVWVGYQMYLFSLQMAARGQQSMNKRNISFNKDGGVTVGVKELSAEEYAAKQQTGLVSLWNLSSWPAYKSRFWNQEAQAAPQANGAASPRPSSSRSSSTASKPATSRHSSSANTKPTTSRTTSASTSAAR